MADKKITDLPVLPVGSIIPATDVIPVVNGGITKQVTLANAVTATFNALNPGVTSVNARTGVVTLTSTDVGLANVNNTSDANKPVSTAQQTALNLKADLASPTFTGTVGGITKTMVGLANVDNTSDVNKPVSTATQQALQSQLYTAFTTAGTSTAYTLTPSPAIAAYTAGTSFFVIFNAACGASPTITINGVATPPNLVKQLGDGTYTNLVAGDVTINHRSRVTLLSATQAWVETLPKKGGLLNTQVFSATGTYTPTPGTTSIEVELVGGGGGGGGTFATAAGQIAGGAGGGAGGYARSYLTSAFSGVTVTVGAAGAAGTAGAAGSSGGTTSFGALLSATGGNGGQAGGAVATGTVTSTTSSNAGGAGSSGNLVNANGSPGAYAFYGSTATISGSGGASQFGGGAPSVIANAAGSNAVSPGAGGSGGSSTASTVALTGGAGAAGRVIIKEYA